MMPERCDVSIAPCGDYDDARVEAAMRAVLEPSKYTGRCGTQVTALVAKIRPLLKDAEEQGEQIEL